MKSYHLSLSDLIDLEVAIEQDRALTFDELKQRDNKVAVELARKSEVPLSELPQTEVLQFWSQAVLGRPTIGVRFVGLVAIIDLLALVAGGLIGAGCAFGVLYYDGSTPINAIQYLGVFVCLQIFLLATLLLTFAFGSRLGVVQEALRSFVYFRSDLWQRLAGSVSTLRRLRKVYRKPESWLLLKVTQRFGVAFNLGALAVALYLVSFTDLAFSWSTTLNLKAEEFYGLLKIISAPWAFAGAEWTLSLDQIRATQFFRLEGQYLLSQEMVMHDRMTAVGSWWRFLLAAHMTYGLLPRLILWLWARAGFWVSLRSIQLDGLVWGRVRRRLVQTEISEPILIEDKTKGSTKKIDQKQPCRIIRWRDFPAGDDAISNFLSEHFGLQIDSIQALGGSASAIDGKGLSSSNTPWLVLVEDWESPGKAIKQLLENLRESGSHAFVLPLKYSQQNLSLPSSQRLKLWQKHLDQMSDPKIGVLV